MAIVLDGSSAAGSINLGTNGTVSNLAAGGLPDATVKQADLYSDVKLGKMLSTPVVGTSSTEYSWTSTTYSDTDLTASITPSATSSKILVQCNLSNQSYANQTAVALGIRLLRDTTTAFTVDVFSMMNDNAAVDYYAYGFFFWLDSPSTTSAITYKIQGARTYTYGSGTLKASLNQNSSIGDGSESYLMLTEIAG